MKYSEQHFLNRYWNIYNQNNKKSAEVYLNWIGFVAGRGAVLTLKSFKFKY